MRTFVSILFLLGSATWMALGVVCIMDGYTARGAASFVVALLSAVTAFPTTTQKEQ